MLVKRYYLSRNAIYFALVSVIILLSAGLITYRIGEPLWESGHHGYHMSEYPHNALNYLRFGYADTKLGLVMNYGPQKPAHGFSYRIDHPMITSVLISLAYRIFGVSPWSARLFPVIFALGTSVTTFALSRQILTMRWGDLVTLAICAFAPMGLYYGRMPAPHNLSTFFTFVFFFIYWRWFSTKKTIYLSSIFFVLVIGAYTDWVIYFAVPAILVHYLIFQKNGKDWKFVLGLASAPFLLFGLYMLWVWWLSGSYAIQGLWNVFLRRTVSSHGLGFSPSVGEILHIVLRRSIYWLTVPVLLLSLGWGAQLLAKVIKGKRVSAQQGFILILLGFGVIHDLSFINLALVHDFVMFYHLVPVFAIMSASFLIDFFESNHQKPVKVFSIVMVLVIAGWFIQQSLQVFVAENSKNTEYLPAYYVGKTLNCLVSSEGRYIDAVDLHERAGQLRAYVTADRPFARADTLAEVRELEKTSLYEAVVVDNGTDSDIALREYLLQKYPYENVMGYSIFDLEGQVSDVSAAPSAIKETFPILFDDKIEFLGFEIEKVAYCQNQTVDWWSRFVNPHVEYLPQHLTLLQGSNYWRTVSDSVDDFELETWICDYNEQSHCLKQSFDGLDNLYPTSMWLVDQIVREDLNAVIPSRHSPLTYGLWIGVRDREGRGLKSINLPEFVDQQNRVRIGQVYVLENDIATAVQVALATYTEIPITVRMEDNILLKKVSMSQGGVFPGDVLLVTLDWETELSLGQDFKIFMHIVTREGELVAQHDSEPNLGRAPTSSWVSGELVRDTHPIMIPGDLAPGDYRIHVGMYQETDMKRLSVGECSVPVEDNAIQVADLEVFSSE